MDVGVANGKLQIVGSTSELLLLRGIVSERLESADSTAARGMLQELLRGLDAAILE